MSTPPFAARGVWPRPVPVIGDPTSASERRADPTGWAFDPAERDALYRVVAARRDVRRFRPDAVPADVLERVLGAGHAGPSVGHSQPWRFIVVTDPVIRDRAAVLTDRERLRRAARLDPDAGRRLLDLRMRAGKGAGAALASGLLREALRVRRETARVDH